jgi:hypothetical protein
MNSDNKPSFTDMWNRREELAQISHNEGWNVDIAALGHVKTPAAFYIFEPLKSGFRAIGVLDRTSFQRVIDNSVTDQKTNEKFIESFTELTGLFFSNIGDNKESLSLLIEAHAINFSKTQTAKVAMAQGISAFGAIVYMTGKGDDFFCRPVIIPGGNAIIPPRDVLNVMCEHMKFDFRSHPEFFGNHDINDLLKKYSE